MTPTEKQTCYETIVWDKAVDGSERCVRSLWRWNPDGTTDLLELQAEAPYVLTPPIVIKHESQP